MEWSGTEQTRIDQNRQIGVYNYIDYIDIRRQNLIGVDYDQIRLDQIRLDQIRFRFRFRFRFDYIDYRLD